MPTVYFDANALIAIKHDRQNHLPFRRNLRNGRFTLILSEHGIIEYIAIGKMMIERGEFLSTIRPLKIIGHPFEMLKIDADCAMRGIPFDVNRSFIPEKSVRQFFIDFGKDIGIVISKYEETQARHQRITDRYRAMEAKEFQRAQKEYKALRDPDQFEQMILDTKLSMYSRIQKSRFKPYVDLTAGQFVEAKYYDADIRLKTGYSFQAAAGDWTPPKNENDRSQDIFHGVYSAFFDYFVTDDTMLRKVTNVKMYYPHATNVIGIDEFKNLFI